MLFSDVIWCNSIVDTFIFKFGFILFKAVQALESIARKREKDEKQIGKLFTKNPKITGVY